MNELNTYICQFCKKEYQSDGLKKPKSFKKDGSTYQYYESTKFCSKECCNKSVGQQNRIKRQNMSQEEKSKLRQKISQTVKMALQSRSEEEKQRFSKVCSEKMKKLYQNRTEKEKIKISENISKGLRRFNKKHPENVKQRAEKCHLTCKNRSQEERNQISKNYSQRAKVVWSSLEESKKQKRNQKINIYWKTHKEELQNKITKTKATKISNPNITIQAVKQNIETKRKNNTFNTSKPEDKLYELLKSKYSDVKRSYNSDPRYPFMCDFYIPSKDLFIELQLSWTHGSKPFDKSDKDCLNQLDVWKQKSLTSNYYRNAIETWTVRDVRKRNIAKQNNLNYIEIWSNDFKRVLTF